MNLHTVNISVGLLYLIPDVTIFILSLAKMQTTATFSSNISRPHPTPDNIKSVPTSPRLSPSLAHGSAVVFVLPSSDNNAKAGVGVRRLMCYFRVDLCFLLFCMLLFLSLPLVIPFFSDTELPAFSRAHSLCFFSSFKIVF